MVLIMDIREVNVFKSQCKEKRSIDQLLTKYRDELDAIWYELGGVKGIRYDTIPVQGSSDRMLKAYREHDLRAKADNLKETIQGFQLISDRVDCVMKLMDDEEAEAVRRIYISKDSTEEEMADEMNMAISTLKRKIIKGIGVALDRYKES